MLNYSGLDLDMDRLTSGIGSAMIAPSARPPASADPLAHPCRHGCDGRE